MKKLSTSILSLAALIAFVGSIDSAEAKKKEHHHKGGAAATPTPAPAATGTGAGTGTGTGTETLSAEEQKMAMDAWHHFKAIWNDVKQAEKDEKAMKK